METNKNRLTTNIFSIELLYLKDIKMRMIKSVLTLFILLVNTHLVFSQKAMNDTVNYVVPKGMIQKIQKTDAEWRAELGDEQFKILRQCSTEPPFTGKYYKHMADGTYICAGCKQELFDSNTKYESGSGWPSFFAAIGKDKITEVRDTTYGMIRIEIRCAKCDGHLGHVFTDGPAPTGLRYCVNSGALDFVERKK